MKRWNVFFAPDDGITGAVPAAPATEPTTTPAATQEAPEAPLYTNKQLNDLVAKNSAKEAAKILKDAGLESTGDLKKDVEAFKAWKQSTMTETDRLKAQLAEREGADTEAKKAADAIRAENIALKKGVPGDKVDRVVKLSAGYEGDTVEERVAAALAEFPEFTRGPVKDIGAPAHGQGVDDDTAMLAKLKEMHKRK
jgi:hypothetical protein